MPLFAQSPTSGEPYVLAASLDKACHISSLLRAVHFQDHTTCFAMANGLRVTVEDTKCIQANAFIQAEILQEFAAQEESVMFWINLSVLLNCLTIFGISSLPGTSTALRMCYHGYGYPLMLFLEEGGVVTVCKINTQEPDELLDFDFCRSIHLDYPRDSDLMEAFHCNQTQTNSYKISLLKSSTKALALSCEVSIRTDTQGFLSLQYMIRNEDGLTCFVEYYCCPDEDITEAEP
ncbi:PREDICTED: cell cycle checkpoint protein RAD1-like, partial [Nipponia nippon]|uniref:cell cycle checkpoint protein RAD1-like n=1 Tax=Nipponia nippon TaxID=128390 RepID=UPI00051180EF